MERQPATHVRSRLVDGLQLADLVHAVIDDYTAKLAAGYLSIDRASTLGELAATGKTIADSMCDELRGLYQALATRQACIALAAYAASVGDRAAVDAWPDLTDQGPPALPGYMGTYASATRSLRELGFRVMVLTCGDVHLFQERESWQTPPRICWPFAPCARHPLRRNL